MISQERIAELRSFPELNHREVAELCDALEEAMALIDEWDELFEEMATLPGTSPS